MTIIIHAWWKLKKNLPTVNLPVCNNVVIDLSLKINDVDFNSFDKKKIVWHTDHVERLVMMRMHLISLSSSLCHTKVVLRLLNTLWYEFWMDIYMIMYIFIWICSYCLPNLLSFFNSPSFDSKWLLNNFCNFLYTKLS